MMRSGFWSIAWLQRGQGRSRAERRRDARELHLRHRAGRRRAAHRSRSTGLPPSSRPCLRQQDDLDHAGPSWLPLRCHRRLRSHPAPVTWPRAHTPTFGSSRDAPPRSVAKDGRPELTKRALGCLNSGGHCKPPPEIFFAAGGRKPAHWLLTVRVSGYQPVDGGLVGEVAGMVGALLHVEEAFVPGPARPRCR